MGSHQSQPQTSAFIPPDGDDGTSADSSGITIPDLPNTDLQPTRRQFIARNIASPALVSLTEDEADCPICYKDMRYSNLPEIGFSSLPVRLPCTGRHVFCQDCLRSWIERQRQHTCPMCREVFLRRDAPEMPNNYELDGWHPFERSPWGPRDSARWYEPPWDTPEEDAARARASQEARPHFNDLSRQTPNPATVRGDFTGTTRRRTRQSSDTPDPPRRRFFAAHYRPENRGLSLPYRARYVASRRPSRTSSQLPTLRIQREFNSQMLSIPATDWEVRPSPSNTGYATEELDSLSLPRSPAPRFRPLGFYQPRVRHPEPAIHPEQLTGFWPALEEPDMQSDVDVSEQTSETDRAMRELLDLDSDAEYSLEANM